jgi:hypothetical protein
MVVVVSPLGHFDERKVEESVMFNIDGFLVSLTRVRMTLCMLYNILIVKERAPLFG